MNTRSLETNDVFRAGVARAKVLETGPTYLLLETEAVRAAKKAVSSADSDMLNQRSLAGIGEAAPGRARIDVVSDHILRIRYAEGDTAPENATRMVVGAPAGPTLCRIGKSDQDLQIAGDASEFLPWAEKHGSGEAIAIRTAALEVLVGLGQFRIEVRDRSGRKLCGIGGPEKDNFTNWDSFNTGIARLAATGDPIATESFDLAYDEAIYGLGEKFIRLNKAGQTIDLNMIDALGVTTPRSYKNIPFYISSHGYGVFFNHSSLMTYWVGSMSACDVQVAAEDDFLDYYVIAGSIKDVLSRYTDLTGKGAVPPDWTFGYWQSKISYSAADETIEIASKMRENEIPCDVIHLDTFWFRDDWYCDLKFDEKRFPDPEAYLSELASLGIKVSLWQLPYIPEGSKLFDDLRAVDGFVKNKDGGIYDTGICFTPGFKGVVGIVDYTNPKARRVHQAAFRELFRLGAKVIKTDFGEAAPLDGVYHDGTPGHRMHNLYPLVYNEAIFEVTREETGDGVVWARSAWAGNQRYPLHWGGDNSANFDNMPAQIAGGLSFGLSGYQFWSQDIGGFLGDIGDSVNELVVRWMQLGMFTSHSRIHGFGVRELYRFHPEMMRICRDYIRLRYSLLPYILSEAKACVAASLPMLRAMVVEFQDDPTTWPIYDQYLFGSSILVAPIYAPENRRNVYLPKGVWTDWWTLERIAGRKWLQIEADLETLPLYIREGAIVPIGPVMNYVGERPIDKITLRIAPFEGDGATHIDVPVNGSMVAVDYRAFGGRHTVTIGKSDAEFTVESLSATRIERA